MPIGKLIFSAHRASQHVAAAHYENFPVASLLVPRPLRAAVLAIYRFARAADDAVDEGDHAPAQRLKALDEFERALDEIEAGETPPAWHDLASTIAVHALPVALFRDLLSAFRQDVGTARYANYADLLDYCRRSANPIGRLLLHLYGAATQSNLIHADAICTALQLINFWQDIESDWQRGRVYLPAEDMARFDIRERQIAERICDERWRAMIDFQTARTRGLLESGRPLVGALPWRLGLELSGVLAGGHRILDGIEAARGDIYRHRPQLTRTDWAIVISHALFPPRRHRACALSA